MCAFVLKYFRRGSVCQRAFICAAVLSFATGSAYAEDHFWSSAGGGSFNDWLNWFPNSVPGEDDRAIFELDMDPAYEVTFYESVTNQECIFRTDKVVLDLGGNTYTLTDAGSGLVVGEDAGHVAEILFSNGTIDSTVTQVGLGEDSAGTLDLESGLTLSISDYLSVGSDGDGVMNILDGASVTTERATIGAYDYGNSGTLNIDGSSAEFTVNDTLSVGEEGIGFLNLLNGATAYCRGGWIGDWAGDGEINITGESEMIVSEWLTFGYLGSGWLTVSQAGRLDVLDIGLGGEWGGYGDVDMFDADSRIDASRYILVGDQGYGTMNVSLQATVTAESLLVGAGETGEGELNISDVGTTVTVQNNLVSGLFGVGVINITNGADVRTTEPGGWIFVGQIAGSDGYILVDGGSTLTAEQAPLVVGEAGFAAMDILGGSEVHTSGELFMGWYADSFGQLTISGEGSKYISESGYPAKIGDEGEGTLILEDGGYLEKTGAFFIGLQSTGVGSVTLNGAQSALKCEQLSVGEYGIGTFNINDGRVALGDVDPAYVPFGEMNMAGYYTQLTGTGTVTGNVVNLGDAKVRPGGDEAGSLTGILTIDGNYEQQDARLTIKIKGTIAGDECSVLNVTGTASLDGTLEITLINGYEWEPGHDYVILTAGSVTGTFDAVTGPEEFEVIYNADNVTVRPRCSPGDLDCDGDVDIDDFELFAGCMNGPDVPYPPDCDAADLDVDEDVDLADFAEFQQVFAVPVP